MDRSFTKGLGDTGEEIGQKSLSECGARTGAGVLVELEYAQDLCTVERYRANALLAYAPHLFSGPMPCAAQRVAEPH